MTGPELEPLARRLDRIGADMELLQRQTREVLLLQGQRLEALERRVAELEAVTAERIREAVLEAIGAYLSPRRLAAGAIALAGTIDAIERIVRALS